MTPVAGCSGSDNSGSGAGVTGDQSSASDTTAQSGYVTVQGHDLSYDCSGEGSPTVVFQHGLGGNSTDWAATTKLLEGVHWCRFDRVNAGDSAQDNARHQGSDSVAELHEFLAAVDVTRRTCLRATRLADCSH